MAMHYNIIISDDHLGMLNGRNVKEEADYINKELKKAGAVIFREFVYIEEIHAICGEFRRTVPSETDVYNFLNKYDYVLVRRECEGFRYLECFG